MASLAIAELHSTTHTYRYIYVHVVFKPMIFATADLIRAATAGGAASAGCCFEGPETRSLMPGAAACLCVVGTTYTSTWRY